MKTDNWRGAASPLKAEGGYRWGGTSANAARLAMALIGAVLVLLASLHFLSPEIDPAWRQVSEYAEGGYAWVLALMFIAWAAGTWACSFAIRNEVRSRLGKIGFVLLVVSGFGEILAVVFPLPNPLHGISDVVGAGVFPVGATLLTVDFRRTKEWFAARRVLLWSNVAIWASILLLILTLAVEAITYINVVGSLPAQEPSSLPAGVIGLSGWANRVLVVAYCSWIVIVARQATKLVAAHSG